MSASDRLAKLKTWLAVLKEKRLPPEGEFAQFLFQEDGFSYCPFCFDRLAEEGLSREEAKPMAYPAVKICMQRPIATPFAGGKGKGLHWHWQYTNFCIEHALEVLLAMHPQDVMPRPEDIHDDDS